MDKIVRWGMVGTGRICRRFMADFVRVPGARLCAVCSTREEKARLFAERYGAPRAYGSIEKMLADGGLDVVYVAVSHTYHREFAVKCLQARVPVLCEKPMAPNEVQAAEMIRAAKEHGVFLMEAFWTRFFPAVEKALFLARTGAIGKITVMTGCFMGVGAHTPGDRLFDPEQAGGALLDIGVYPVQFASMFAGPPGGGGVMPARIASLSRFSREGVDETDGIVLEYPGGEMAVLHTTLAARGESAFAVYGTDGSIYFPDPFYRPARFQLRRGDEVQEFRFDLEGEGFQYEIAHVQDCLIGGLTESPLMPLERTLRAARTCDLLRSQWGLRYPFENDLR